MPSSPADTAWVLLGAAFILLIQAGLVAFELGITRRKNAVGTAINRLATVLTATVVLAVSAKLVLGIDVLGGRPTAATATAFTVHLLLCGLGAGIALGATAERLRLLPAMILALVFAGVSYPVMARLGWGGSAAGWLRERGYRDLAGAGVVHILGGAAALAAAMLIGARRERFPSGKNTPIPGSNPGTAVVGTALIWVGWIGYELAAGGGERSPGLVALGALLAGASGGMIGLLFEWGVARRPEVTSALTGLLAGLVAHSAGGALFSPGAALVVGCGAGLISQLSARALVSLRIDDASAAVSIHLIGGLWGLVAVGLLTPLGLLGTGLTRGAQVAHQLEGAAIAAGLGGALAAATCLVLRLVPGLRPRPTLDEELAGASAAQHDLPDESSVLIDAMEEQARTGDMSLRAPVEAFTEIGQVAQSYNRVIETLQFVTAQTESLVRTSLDGLITFNTKGIVTSSNPGASAIFGYAESEFRSVVVTSLFAPSPAASDGSRLRLDLAALLELLVGSTAEMQGQRRSGSEFPMETSFNYVAVGEDEIYTATFRDTTQRKETEAELARTQAEIQRRMEQELENAKVVQTALLPQEQHFPGCEIALHFQSASETGGDWFGYQYHPETQAITCYIGDVTGHGLASALLSGVVCGAVYSHEYTSAARGKAAALAPEAKLRGAADVINRIVQQTGKGDLLMTMAFVHISLKTGILTLLNAGHNAPILVRSGESQALVARGSRLGDLAKPDFEVTQVSLKQDDLVLLYTDGLIENTGPDGRVFNMRNLKRVLADGQSAAELRDQVLRGAQEVWRGNPADDDHSMLVLRWTRAS